MRAIYWFYQIEIEPNLGVFPCFCYTDNQVEVFFFIVTKSDKTESLFKPNGSSRSVL